MADNNYLTESERSELVSYLTGYGSPIPSDKENLHTFLTKVVTSPDTTKLGYLKDEEIGMPKNPIRTHKELALFSDKVIENQLFVDYFNGLSEITTSTSLSRNAKLLNLAVIQRKQVEDITKPKKKNKGWFKKKEDNEEQLE